MSFQSIQFSGDPILEACVDGIRGPIPFGSVGGHIGKIQFALATLDRAAIDPEESADERFGESTAAAVRRFRRLRDLSNNDEIEDLADAILISAIDSELASNSLTDPRTAAIESAPRALEWIDNAIIALNDCVRSIDGASEPTIIAKVAMPFVRLHFHTDRSRFGASERTNLIRIEANYQIMRRHLCNSKHVFRSVNDIVATRDTLGAFRPGVIVGGYAFPFKSVSFTSHFLSLGPNCRAAVIIHELGHYVSPSIGHTGGERGFEYDNSPFETAINNVYCYPNFAVHVTVPFRDERYGMSRPND